MTPDALAANALPVKRWKMYLVFAIALVASLAQGAAGKLAGGGAVYQGRVELPDGTPAAGASVTAEGFRGQSSCGVAAATADSKGQFEIFSGVLTPSGVLIPSIRAECERIHFSARFLEALWLPTGRNVFSLLPNGSEPEVELIPGRMPQPVVIRLGDRGGEVTIRIQDVNPTRFIRGVVLIERTGVSGHEVGRLENATGDDGQAFSALLPEGRYTATLEQYPCGSKTYFAASAAFPFEVKAGDRIEKILQVDTRSLDAITSSDNPKGSKCTE